MRIRLHINGVAREVNVPPRTSLLAVLRDDLDLTGSRYGCGHGACGACYVLAGGRAVASCTLSAEEAVGLEIVTVEGLAKGGRLHAVQQAFVDEDAMQCGYCTSGMLISAAALLARSPHPTEEEIHEALGPHLCRCGVYLRAVRAVKRAAR
ncbi:MAG TPA: (2Fe-2S)-binding protein [Vicinamibacterales bacterium]|nr:(2Fe-2S)-binding protein [Vicinamibacterales bacterium]